MSRAAMSWVDGPHLCKVFVKNSALKYSSGLESRAMFLNKAAFGEGYKC